MKKLSLIFALVLSHQLLVDSKKNSLDATIARSQDEIIEGNEIELSDTESIIEIHSDKISENEIHEKIEITEDDRIFFINSYQAKRILTESDKDIEEILLYKTELE